MKNVLITVLFIGVFSFFVFPARANTSKPQNYELPFPGIMPDNPIYFLKLIRDDIEGFLISNPIKKAEFLIDKADMGMAVVNQMVIDKRSVKEIDPVLEKIDGYFLMGLDKIDEAERQGIEVKDLRRHIDLAGDKYEEICDRLRDKDGEKHRDVLERLR